MGISRNHGRFGGISWPKNTRPKINYSTIKLARLSRLSHHCPGVAFPTAEILKTAAGMEQAGLEPATNGILELLFPFHCLCRASTNFATVPIKKTAGLLSCLSTSFD